MSALGQKQTLCNALTRVRFTPNSDRESGLPRKVMSALLPKADMRVAQANVHGRRPLTDRRPSPTSVRLVSDANGISALALKMLVFS